MKNDEFYTQLTDIEKELNHYTEYFASKTVYCNCDDPYESNFFKYFVLNFNRLKLKKLIATCYKNSPISNKELSLFPNEPIKTTSVAHKIIVTEVVDEDGDGAQNLNDIKLWLARHPQYLKKLKGDGDFRSSECVKLLDEVDVVVTNPPHSLFREYISVLEQHNKNFLVIGNLNAVTYKEIFKLIKENKLWLGVSISSGDREFIVPDSVFQAIGNYRIDDKGVKYARVMGVRWYTNIDHKKRHEPIILYRNYTPEAYPKYDNYDAIEVSKVSEIPMDWDGVMGVPISFMDKYNPEQFEILGTTDRGGDNLPEINRIRLTEKPEDSAKINGKKVYKRIFIRRKK